MNRPISEALARVSINETCKFLETVADITPSAVCLLKNSMAIFVENHPDKVKEEPRRS